MKNIIVTILLICFGTNALKAQIDYNKDAAKAYARRGSGNASNNKLYKKYIQLIDIESKQLVINHYVTFYKKVTALGMSKTDEKGYAMLVMRNSNYYKSITVDVNPNANDPQNPIRNKTVYIPLNDGKITFTSKKEVIDTLKVYVKKVK